MGIAITEAHVELQTVADSFLRSISAREANRAVLETAVETLPPFWDDVAKMGWLGLHVPEELGGSGYGLEELTIVVEALGRAVAPGPFVPTVIASAVIAVTGSAGQQQAWLPGLVDGTTTGALGFGLGGSLTVSEGFASGSTGVVLGAGLAQLVLVLVGDDVVLFDRGASGVSVTIPVNADPSRRSGTFTLDRTPVDVIPGAARHARALARTIVSAEAAGGARECCDEATGYAKVREQFGRPIGMFQAVKHHCANMLVAAELATAATWDAARAAEGDLAQFELAAAVAATLAVPSFLANSHLNIQVHGGIGYTWEHDAHLLMRRALALEAIVGTVDAQDQVIDSTRAGVVRAPGVNLPPEAEALRAEIRAFAVEVAALDKDAQREKLIATGYVMPHWPKPWGREAGAIEQLVIDEEFAAAGVKRPQYGITSWVILTLAQHGTQDQVDRWVAPALNKETVWCQLFSEPGAGSDAAAVKTKATRTEGGWIINGQKVWTSDAHRSQFGMATVRTDSSGSKHHGITAVVVNMQADGVDIRPLRQMTGESHFNEVFFTDVFVPDADVVGTVNEGWAVARATLGNERVSIGGGASGGLRTKELLPAFDADPKRTARLSSDLARLLSISQALLLLNLRRAARALAGAEPGPEGNVTKLVLAEGGQALASLSLALGGPDSAFLEGPGRNGALLTLITRGMSIAGGTSEITRNQIAERLLGLPRDPTLQ